jgi:hypothetical protein
VFRKTYSSAKIYDQSQVKNLIFGLSIPPPDLLPSGGFFICGLSHLPLLGISSDSARNNQLIDDESTRRMSSAYLFPSAWRTGKGACTFDHLFLFLKLKYLFPFFVKSAWRTVRGAWREKCSTYAPDLNIIRYTASKYFTVYVSVNYELCLNNKPYRICLASKITQDCSFLTQA